MSLVPVIHNVSINQSGVKYYNSHVTRRLSLVVVVLQLLAKRRNQLNTICVQIQDVDK